GPPSIDIDEKQDMRLLYDSNGTPRVIEGNGRGLTAALSLGPSFAGGEQAAASVMNPTGGGVSAWPSSDPQGNPAVSVREDFSTGAAQTALVSGGAGGEVAELAVGRSGLGDGLVGFRQGPLGNAAIVAAQATAPPVQFILNAPEGWSKPSAASIAWLPATSADGPLSYRVVLDGHAQASAVGGLSTKLDGRGLGSGVHRIQVLATDLDGQQTLSSAAPLRIDGTPPIVKIVRTARGHAVRVRISDPDSGVAKSAISVSFGDGHSVAKRARVNHRYASPGVYTIVAHVRDRIGNQAIVRRLVTIR
ncbi:MAG: PKD domain-containing protein, partial [Solirubrobacteraceae bacterium]